MTAAALLAQAAAPLAGAGDLLSRLSASRIIVAVAVLAIAFVATRVVVLLFDNLGQRAPRARFFFKMLAPVVRLALWIVAAAVILLGVFAPPVATLVAVLAPIGIALGLGSQELVKNVVGGVAILFDRPYQLGDRVRIGDAYGEIDHIGLYSTKLTTTDDTRVTIPNSLVLTGMAWNANSGNPDMQVVTDLFLPHDADPIEARQVVLEAAFSSPYVLLSKPVVVRIKDRFQDGPYTLVRVKAYVYDHRFERAFQSDITVRAKSEFLARGMLLRWSRHDDGPSTAERRASSTPTTPARGANARR
jgi:small-conductance mechanosensitive channel